MGLALLRGREAGEGRALADLGLDRQPPAVAGQDVLDDRQAEAGALSAPGLRSTIDAIEALGDARNVFGGECPDRNRVTVTSTSGCGPDLPSTIETTTRRRSWPYLQAFSSKVLEHLEQLVADLPATIGLHLIGLYLDRRRRFPSPAGSSVSMTL